MYRPTSTQCQRTVSVYVTSKQILLSLQSSAHSWKPQDAGQTAAQCHPNALGVGVTSIV